MTRAGLALCLLAILAPPSAGQVGEAGITYGPWLLDIGTFSNAATVRPSISAYVRIGAPAMKVTWAPEDDFDPGVAMLTVGLRPHFFDGHDARVFADLEVGAAHVAADNQEADLRDCTAENGCMFEGISYKTGWGPVAGLALGAGLRIFEHLHLELSGGLSLSRVDRTRLFARSAFGIAWRR